MTRSVVMELRHPDILDVCSATVRSNDPLSGYGTETGNNVLYGVPSGFVAMTRSVVMELRQERILVINTSSFSSNDPLSGYGTETNAQ